MRPRRTTPGSAARALGIVLGIAALTACAARKDVATETVAPKAAKATTTEIFRHGAQALVRIETPHRFGGGFVVGADGIIVTTYSLLVHEFTAYAVLSDGGLFAIDRVLAVLPEHDLALVSIDAHGLVPLELAARRPPSAGEHIVVVGHALGMAGPALADAVVGAIPSTAESGAFEIASEMPAGFFGAPVLDDSGRAVGMVGVQRPNGATVLHARSIARMLAGIEPRAGETMQAFGERTRSADGWEETPVLGPHVLDDCSADSRARIWGEIETAIETGAPVFELGGSDAAFRVLEGAVFYLARELPDCKGVVDVLLTEAADGRSRDDSSRATTRLAETMHAALELLFGPSLMSESIGRGAKSSRPPSRRRTSP
jgi:hypothetical protein